MEKEEKRENHSSSKKKNSKFEEWWENFEKSLGEAGNENTTTKDKTEEKE
jgi:hypothetical protein